MARLDILYWNFQGQIKCKGICSIIFKMDQVKQIGNYTYNQKFCLGEGSFGKVYEGISKSNKKVAIKKVDKKLINSDEYLKSSIESEINILKKFNHPNIVKLEEVVFTANSIYIVTQYCKNGDLKAYLRNKKPKQQQCINIFTQIVAGFKEIVKQGIIHRDLKPPNILVHENVFKICDFGFAKYFKDLSKMSRTCVGTPMYMSPQTLKQKPYTNKSDVWSVGIVFFEMLFGKTPWQGNVEQQLYKNIINKALYIPTCSKFASTVLKGMLEVEQVNRWSWEKVIQYVESEGLSYNTKKLIQPFLPNNQKAYYTENSSNIYKKTVPEETDIIPKNQNYFQQEKQVLYTTQDAPGTKSKNTTSRDIKPKPKNMLAYFLQQQEQEQKQENRESTPPNVMGENHRFCYFILIQLYLNPLKATSFEPFLYTLKEFTIDKYILAIDKEKPPLKDLLTSELKQIKQLQIPKPRSGNPAKLSARQLGSNILAEEKNITQSRQWIRRFCDKKYIYDPL